LASLLVAALTTVALVGALIDFAIGYRRLRYLGDIAPGDRLPPLSIVAAARNEARHIEPAVTSLLDLDYPALEIIVIDDRSIDETGAILDRVAAGDPRLGVVHVRELPDGWLGKNHALQVGADRASGALLLFTDADVIFEPTTLRRAAALMERDGLDHLAAIPHVEVPGVALNAFVAAFGVFFSLYSRPWKARDARSRHHIGIGAFNLIRATAYHAIGGHHSLAMRPDDDMKLGKVVKKSGFKQDAVHGRDFIIVEWYASIGELVDGLMKNAFAGVNYSLWAVVGSTIGLFVTQVWPFVALLVTSGAARALSGLNVVLIVLIFWTSARASGTKLAYVVAFPFASLLFAYIMWRSALIAVTTGTVSWRGTAYPLAKMRANRV